MEVVKQLIKSNKVMMFSKSYCPYCTLAKEVLRSANIEFKTMELDQEANGAEVQDALESLTGQRTVPNVFVGGKSIGGGTDVQKLHADGKLQALVDAA